MGYDGMDESVGVVKSNMTEFYDELRAKLLFITGLADYTEDMKMMPAEDMRNAIYHPIMAIGLPGIGKTGGIISIVKDISSLMASKGMTDKIGFKKIQLGQTTVGELQGIPIVVNGEAKRTIMEDLPDEARDGKFGVLFLDELTTADEMQVQPALGLADDSRSIGVYKLPENWLVVGAGNGPECANFVRCDDMLLSRFSVFDIEYDYVNDWRGWAYDHRINDMIIAFLNMHPEYIVKPASIDTDKSGKQFPCPRTWTSLSGVLAMRRKQMSEAEMRAVASREIGIEAADKFAAFVAMRDMLMRKNPNLIEDILSGKIKETAEKKGISQTADVASDEDYAITLQMLIKTIRLEVRAENPDGDVLDFEYSDKIKQRVANMYSYLISYEMEGVIAALMEVIRQVKEISAIVGSDDFSDYCPEFDDFIEAASDATQGLDLNSMRL